MTGNTRGTRRAMLMATAVLVAAASGCAWTTGTGPLQTETRIVEVGDAESAVVHLRMGAGGLSLSGGAEELARAEVTTNVEAWLPTIDYVVAGGQGDLSIEQPEVKNLGLEGYRYAWDVRLNDEVPMALDVALGAGESDIDVSTLSISSLDLKMGVGGVQLDLTGERERDVDVTLRGGLGEATILLPREVGVEARVTGGLGEVDATGLSMEGDRYVNEAHGELGATITLDIEGGVGGITLRVAG